MDKRSNMLGSCDPAKCVGLEFGPLMSPMVSKLEGSIYYVDHDTTENIKAKYRDDPNVDCAKIVEIDFVRSAPLSEVVGALRFDYIIASHVFEHLPDPIGWLNECASVLKPRGRIGLAIPDKRVTFDEPRQLTRLDEWVGAFVEKERSRARHLYSIKRLR